MDLLQKQTEMNTSPSVHNPTVALLWYQFGTKSELSVNLFSLLPECCDVEARKEQYWQDFDGGY